MKMQIFPDNRMIIRRKGFSLIELLIAILIMGTIAGISSLVYASRENFDKTVREEADKFALWLTEKMTRAQLEECSFRLSMSQHSTKNASFRITWQGGTLHGKTETYKTSKARIFPVTGDLSRPRAFDGEWGSMTPALTVDIKALPPGKAGPLYVVVSGAGCVTVKDRVN